VNRTQWVCVCSLLAIALLAGCGSDGNGSSGHAAYVTVPTSNQIAGFRLDDGSGKLNPMTGSPYATGPSPSAIAVDPAGKFAYVANASESTLSLFNVASTGALSEVLPRTNTGTTPAALAIDSAGKFLYVSNVGAHTIGIYAIDSSKGTLTQTAGSGVFTGFGASAMKLSPSGKFLYVVNSSSGVLVGYAVDGTTGNLTQLPKSPFPTGINALASPFAITIDSAEKFLYVANLQEGSFGGFTIDSTSGDLTVIAGSPFATGVSPSGIAEDPSGKFLYVSSLSGAKVYAYSLDATGIPTETDKSPFTAGTGTNFVAIDSSGKYLYAGSQSNKNINGFSIDATTGDLTGTPGSPYNTNANPTSMIILP
jgi:6-phosphogluconolactonase